MPCKKTIHGIGFKTFLTGVGLLAVFVLALSPALAAKKRPVPAALPLNAAGIQLEAKYAATRKTLQEEIRKALPKIDEQQKAVQPTLDPATKNAQASATVIQTDLEGFLKSDKLDARLRARVVTGSPELHLCVVVNAAQEPVDIAAPYAIGSWQATQPGEITLAKRKNVLHFTRPEPVKGMTIKDFTLTPVT